MSMKSIRVFGLALLAVVSLKSCSYKHIHDDNWIDAFREKKQSPGSFLLAGPISETINLGAIALRTRKKILYDSAKMEITNVPEANKFLRREYRKGWEL